uniref:Small EDRK-rich factor-like N-terminal domain-containing protein n=1 Tax=Scophthalmus maximus TaxID=52904 RepID=A0A8D3A404_SCOMX
QTRCCRGNQRELARQKNAKKATDHGKGKRGDDGLSAAARKQSKFSKAHYGTVVQYITKCIISAPHKNKQRYFYLRLCSSIKKLQMSLVWMKCSGICPDEVFSFSPNLLKGCRDNAAEAEKGE